MKFGVQVMVWDAGLGDSQIHTFGTRSREPEMGKERGPACSGTSHHRRHMELSQVAEPAELWEH